MVVLENSSSVMTTNSGNQYLPPDYLSPSPSTLDAKNSPLALLAQTCSQIGADPPNTKPMPSMDRKKPSSTGSSADRNSANGLKSQENKSPENKLAFKPYEMNVLTRKTEPSRPPSGNTETSEGKTSRASSRKSASASPHQAVSPNEKSSSPISISVGESKSHTPTEPSTSKADLYASLKESSFKPPFSLSPLANFGCNGCPTVPLDPTNPAFRSAFNSAHLPHPSLLDAACFQSSSTSPYVSYTRVKTPTGSEALVPVCKDPFCFSCRFALHGNMGACPPGCVQCEQKYSAAAAMLMSHPFSSYPYGRPYVCNWVAGESYCGKRFRNSDELLQHLRTHTNSNDPIALMNHLRYPSGGINPLAAAAAASRYHPYSKPGLPPSLAASPFSAFNPTLGPYYSPYSLYDQRIGAAVNP